MIPLSTHKTSVHADGLLSLSYLSPKLFFKIKTFAGLSHVFLNYNELSPYPKFLLIHDPKINYRLHNKYTLYKTAKSQTVGHFYQHRQLKLLSLLRVQ